MNMLFSTTWLSTIFTEYEGHVSETKNIKQVTTDSRIQTNQSLFIPLVGENFDGHDFVQMAIDNGAVALLWEKTKPLPINLPKEMIVYFVQDTLEGLQILAKQYRQVVEPTVVGITGSNGKTTTKDLVAAIAKTTYKTHFTHGNLNNHIGLPLTILSMPRDTEVLVLEMGMNNFGEIEQLSKIAQPDFAMIVNIGESHIEFLGSREGIAQAKLEILAGIKQGGYLIIDGDEELLKSAYNEQYVISCGVHESNDLQISHIRADSTGKTTFKLSNGNTYTIPLLGKHHVHNATYAIALGELLDICNDQIQAGLEHVNLTSMRMELMKGANNVSIINDAYNASPTSMKAAIETTKQIEGFREKVLILGDILELGEYSRQFHEEVAYVVTPPITAVMTYGEEAQIISKTVENLRADIMCAHFQNKALLLEQLQQYLHKDTILLFKASRGMQFETLVKAIQEN